MLNNLFYTRVVVCVTCASDADTDPFVEMLDGGSTGSTYAEIQDLFIFSQIRSQGEDTMSPRVCGDTMPLSELPNFMRAIGFYPSEHEVSNGATPSIC